MMLTVDGQRAAYLALRPRARGLRGKQVGPRPGGWPGRPGRGGTAGVDPPARHRRRSPARPDTDTPGGWREHVRTSLGRVAPHRMTDGRTPAFRDWAGLRPDTWLDRAIRHPGRRSWPLHGLGPLP